MEALGVILQDLQGVQRQGVPAAGPHEILYGLLRTSHTGQCERLGQLPSRVNLFPPRPDKVLDAL